MHSKTIAKVVGVGGAGINAVNRMIDVGLPGLEFIAIDFDWLALERSKAPSKLQLTSLYPRLTFPEFGDPARIRNRESATAGREQIRKTLGDADCVFIVAGLGGGTGTGVAPVIAETARQIGALTVGVVTRPFLFEGKGGTKVAETGIRDLSGHVNTLIVISDECVLKLAEKRKMIVTEALYLVDDNLRCAVQCIVGLTSVPCLFTPPSYNESVGTILRSKRGESLAGRLGIGMGSGKNRAKEAAHMAITSPLLEEPFKMASGVLIEIICAPEITVSEINEAAKIVVAASRPTARTLYDVTIDKKLKDELCITVVCLYEQHELRIAV